MTLNITPNRALAALCFFILLVFGSINKDFQNAAATTKKPLLFKTKNMASSHHDDSNTTKNNNSERRKHNISISYSIRHTSNNDAALDYAQESYNCDLGIMNPDYCRDNSSQLMYRKPLNESLASLTTEFTTSISANNLNVLILGDSLGIQFYNMLVTGMGFSTSQDKKVLDHFTCFTEKQHVSLSLTTSNKTKNRLAAWRVYDFLAARNENTPLPSCVTHGIGWNREQVARLRGETTETYDTMLFRIPHGHLALGNITKRDIWETLQLAQELMGVQTVIIATLPLINNVSPQLESTWEAKNEELRYWIDEYETGSIPGIDAIVYIDFAQLMNEIVLENARHLYHNTTKIISNGTEHNADDISWLKRLSCKGIRWRWSTGVLAQMCSSLPKAPEKCVCAGNSISEDGMHFCPQTFASRFLAGIGCLWKCMYSSSSLRSKVKLRQCQNECNAKFMTLRPLEVLND